MISISICDDSSVICGEIEQALKTYARTRMQALEIEIYYSGARLLQVLRGGKRFDLIFLDIELRESSGVEIGRMIRNELHDEAVQIVYISTQTSYAMALFDIRPLHFLIKPLSPEDIIQNVEKAIALMGREKTQFSFSANRRLYQIPCSSIVYLMSNAKRIQLFTIQDPNNAQGQETYEFYGQLRNVIQELPRKHFFRIHKSFIVNDVYVKECDYDEVRLSTGMRLPISQPYRKGFREQLMGTRRGW